MDDFQQELARLKNKRNPYADWRDDALLQCNKYMWENQINCDIKFLVGGSLGKPEEFCCHKYVLHSRSPIMNKMLTQRATQERKFSREVSTESSALPKGVYSDTESADGDNSVDENVNGASQEEEEVIKLPDIHPDAFYELLRYIYYEQADVDENNMFLVYQAACHFHMRLLEERCKMLIHKECVITGDNVCELLDKSLFYKAYYLTKDCVDYIDAHPKVCETEAFNAMSKAALERVYMYFKPK